MKRLIALLLAALLLTGLCACGAPAEKPEQATGAQQTSEQTEKEKTAEADADAAPAIQLADQYGKTHSLSDYKGKVVLLNFWATWCPNCVKEMPDLQALYEKEAEKEEPELILLGVAAPEVGKETDAEGIKTFLAENGYTYPTLLDDGGAFFARYAVTSYPTTFVIGRDGEVFGYVPGALSAELLQKIVDQALQSA